MKGLIAVFFVLVVFSCKVHAQSGRPTIIRTDSTTERRNPAFFKDTVITVIHNDTVKTVSAHNPGKATLRSLILPGWGQAYNHEYWKIPIVYAAVGTMAGFWIFNNTWYKRTKLAYDIKVNRPMSADTTLINPRLQPLSAASLLFYRNAYRRDRDYSTLYFILAWGLNVADATVFGNLRQFDVSPDLSLEINPVIKPHSSGLSLVLAFKQPIRKPAFLP